MKQENIEFTINRDENGLTGFTLVGKAETGAECYCVSFALAQPKGRASVRFENGQIIFDHKGLSDDSCGIYGYSEGGVFAAQVSPEDQKDLEDLMSKKGKYIEANLCVKLETAWFKGFTLYAKF